MNDHTDDFNASSDGLSATWTQVYKGDGSGFMQRATDNQRVEWKQNRASMDGLAFYGSMPDSQGRTVGER